MKRKIASILLCLAIYGLVACGAPAGQAGERAEGGAAEDSIICYVGHTFWDSSLDPVKGAFSYGWGFTNNALLKVQPDSSYV